MVTKILKWAGIVLGSLVLLAAALVLVLSLVAKARLARHYDIQPEAVSLPVDAVSLQRGQKLATTLCAHCHARDYAGKPLIDDAQVGYVPATNLTAGAGGAGGEFTDGDWVRALRHGVDPQGRALIGMPSQNYYFLNDQDLGELIAYLKSVPPVDHSLGEPALSTMGKVLLAAGAFGENILPAEKISHNSPRPAAVEPGVNEAYGEYLARLGGCHDCHGSDYTGGKSPEPGAPHAPDLTPKGAVGAWSPQTFITAVRTMQGQGMPWEELKPMTDPELKAMFLFLQSLPGK